MKKYLKLDYLPHAVVLLGLVGLGLHQLLYAVGIDRMGLPIPRHPAAIVLGLYSVAVIALIAAAAAPLKGTGEYRVNFPAGPKGAAGSWVLAVCILGTVMFQPCEMWGTMSQIWRWLGLGAALALMWAGLCRFRDQVPSFALHLLVCLFFAFHLLTHYRVWSGTYRILSYLFPLLGGMTLVFFSYYRMAFAVGFGRRRMLLLTGLSSLYLGAVGLLDTDFRVLWLGSMFWVCCDLCAWHVPPEKPREKPAKESAP